VQAFNGKQSKVIYIKPMLISMIKFFSPSFSKRVHTFNSLSVIIVIIFFTTSYTVFSQAVTHWWPETGTIMLGGGHLTDSTAEDFEERFVSIAGGTNAVIVIIPTANPRFTVADLNELKTKFESLGAKSVVVLNAQDHNIANSDSFATVLKSATGVFMTGGESMLLQKIYRGTRVEAELRALLGRGGIVAGDSAGAITIGCMWLTWLPDPFGKRTDELCLLPNVAVSPHANAARGFEVGKEVLTYLNSHPTVIGIDIDENTMLVLNQTGAEVIGKGHVSILDVTRNKKEPVLIITTDKRHNWE
jgi:cyanophycinase